MQINYNRDKYLSEFSIKTLEDRYLIGDEKSPQEAFARAARSFSEDDSDRFLILISIMMRMPKDFMTMLASCGSCFLRQFYRTAGVRVECQ